MKTLVRLTKIGYYADFVFYPALLLCLGGAAMVMGTRQQRLEWAVLCLTGIAAWTLLEYLLHRFVFHHVAVIRKMHDMHHAMPTATIGTPTWVTGALLCGGLLLPLWREAGFIVASGCTAGLAAGYLWYVTVHHATHHWRTRQDSYMYRAKRRHAAHHHLQQPCNFGVTNGFWDRVFGTAR